MNGDDRPMVWILVERTEGGFTATASDECGTIGGPVTRNLRVEAVKRCRIQAERLMDRACRFEERSFSDGDRDGD